MKNLFVIIVLLFSVSAFAQIKAAATNPARKHVQGVCEEKDYRDSDKFKCWWGSSVADSIVVNDYNLVNIGLRDGALMITGRYDKRHTHIFYGLGGDDEIIGGERSDIIFGGNGNDMLRGGPGDDFIYGDKGYDTLYGEEGNDHLIGGPDLSNDVLFGGTGDDYLDAGKGSNGSFGGPGNDRVLANENDGTILPDDENQLGHSDEVIIFGLKDGVRDIKLITSKRYAFDKNDTITFQVERP